MSTSRGGHLSTGTERAEVTDKSHSALQTDVWVTTLSHCKPGWEPNQVGSAVSPFFSSWPAHSFPKTIITDRTLKSQVLPPEYYFQHNVSILMISNYSTSLKSFYNNDLLARSLFWFCVLKCPPSSIYLSNNLVKTDVMWSSSGGKKVKQPILRANITAQEITVYYLFVIMAKSVCYSINMLRIKMVQNNNPR